MYSNELQFTLTKKIIENIDLRYQSAKDFYALKAKYIAQRKQGLNQGA